MEQPYVLDETEDFAVVYKPPRMHSAPLKKGGGDTLLDWYVQRQPAPPPLKEGGLLHRLDYETQGLLLFAKNQPSLDYLSTLQEEGNFIKEYSAICHKSALNNSSFSFPPPPFSILRETPCITPCHSVVNSSYIIESYFRPFGPGRKQVRPVTEGGGKGKEIARDKGGYYRTEIVNAAEDEDGHYAFTIRLRRGFRHQIRCHLAWAGCPVLNDPLYGAAAEDGGFLALRSYGLIFTDPKSGKPREYRILTPNS